jgi:hypothetical protein
VGQHTHTAADPQPAGKKHTPFTNRRVSTSLCQRTCTAPQMLSMRLMVCPVSCPSIVFKQHKEPLPQQLAQQAAASSSGLDDGL